MPTGRKDKAMTKKEAKKIVEEYKDRTGYFDNSLRYEAMENMFRYQMRFGEAETKVILASLTMAGAKFR